MQNAAFSRSEKSLELASVHGGSGFSAVARRMRRLPGPRGGAVRQVASATTDVDANSDNDDFATWAPHSRAKTQKEGEDGDRGAKKEEKKREGRRPETQWYQPKNAL